MAIHYRETNAAMFKEFDNSQHSYQFYMDIASEGLIYEIGNNSIYPWTSKPQIEKDRIKKTISDYIENNKSESCQL